MVIKSVFEFLKKSFQRIRKKLYRRILTAEGTSRQNR